MEETRQRFTKLSVPPLRSSWSWQRLYRTVHTLIDWWRRWDVVRPGTGQEVQKHT